MPVSRTGRRLPSLLLSQLLSSEPFVEAEDLACARGGRAVFSDVSFTVGGGQLLALTGPNGAGKSSLLRLVAGLIPAAGGRLRVAPASDDAPLHLLAYADACKPALSLRDNLGFWRRVYGTSAEAPLIDEAAETVGLDHALDLPAGVLSSGQRRRAGLARLLLSPRPIWLLDEPTAALDAEGEALFGRLLAAHLDQGGLAIAATHAALPVPASATLRLVA